MNENVVQIGVALVIVNLVAWGGFTMLQDDETNEVIKYITETVYEQEELAIANVTVNIDYNGAEENATANTNITTVQYSVTVIGDNSFFNHDTTDLTIFSSSLNAFFAFASLTMSVMIAIPDSKRIKLANGSSTRITSPWNLEGS